MLLWRGFQDMLFLVRGTSIRSGLLCCNAIVERKTLNKLHIFFLSVYCRTGIVSTSLCSSMCFTCASGAKICDSGYYNFCYSN